MEEITQKDTIRAFYNGFRYGLRLYAWWGNDGEQHVGTCGRTLKQALDDIDKEERLVLLGE